MVNDSLYQTPLNPPYAELRRFDKLSHRTHAMRPYMERDLCPIARRIWNVPRLGLARAGQAKACPTGWTHAVRPYLERGT